MRALTAFLEPNIQSRFVPRPIAGTADTGLIDAANAFASTELASILHE